MSYYQIILERKWSRNTHPTNFPKDFGRTSFTELIGASHTLDYKFWRYGTKASVGLQALAEHGITDELEDEIKENLGVSYQFLNDELKFQIKITP